MAIFPHSCPQCGAPLSTPPAQATQVVCQHCQTTIYASTPSVATPGPRTLSAADMAFLQELVQANKRTEAIEMYCRLTGSSLSAAYEAINGMQVAAATPPATATPAVPWDEIRALVQSQRKIEAIKRLRETTQLGLKEAKDIADALERGEPPPADLQLRAELPPATAAEPLAQVYTLMKAGQKIQAIKAYREATGVGLAEAKEAVEDVMDRGASQLPTSPKPRVVPPTSQSGLEAVQQLMQAGRKIEAIKVYRSITGVGLKEAKDAVEALERGQPIPQGTLVPGPRPPKEKRGCGSLLVFMALAALLFSGGCGLYVQQTALYRCATTHLKGNTMLQETLGRPVQLVGPALVQTFSEEDEGSGSRLAFTIFTGISGPKDNGILQVTGSGREGSTEAFVYATLYRDFKAMEVPMDDGSFVECP